MIYECVCNIRAPLLWDSSYSQSTSKTLEITEQSETPTTTENAITSQHMTTSSHSEEGDSSSSEKSNSSTSGESRVRTGRVVGAVVGAVLLTVVIVVFVIAVAKRIRPFRFVKHCFESRQHEQQSGCVNEHFKAPDTRMTIEEDMATSTAADNISRRQTGRFQQDNGLTDRFKDNHDSSRINQTLPPLRTVHLFEEDSGSNYVPVTVRALYENNRQADPFEEDSDGYYVPVTPRTHVDNKQHTEPFNVDSNGYLGPLTTRTHAENKQQTEQFDEDSNGYLVPVTPRDHAENKQQTKPFDEDINGNLVPVTIRTHAENKQQTKQFDEDSDGYCYLVPVTPTTHDENKHHAEQFEEDSDSYEVPRQRTDDGGNMENQAQILDNDNNRKYGAARFYLPAMARKAAHSYDNFLDFVDVNTATEKQLYIDEPIYDNNIAWTGKDESTDVHVYAKDQGRSHYEEMNLI
ncbi:uncharacterized protein [Littorina saxatilis]|uniref:uncharacterized protein isoform X2 n=1 Tax=Littorina saxatilis TaxID=31220 RepID=UPI0038B59CA8